MLSTQSLSKIKGICKQFSFTQITCIKTPSQFTELASSLIDIILTNNETHLLYTEVGDIFLNQEICYHCLIFGILNFTKPKCKSYLCHTLSYDQADYNFLREKAATTIWESIYHQDTNRHVKKIKEHIIDILKVCIPNRLTWIQPDENLSITATKK